MGEVMRLWLLRPVELHGVNDPWSPWYDKAFGFVVRAQSAEQARAIASTEAGDETRSHPSAWLNDKLSTCIELNSDGDGGMIIQDFAAA